MREHDEKSSPSRSPGSDHRRDSAAYRSTGVGIFGGTARTVLHDAARVGRDPVVVLFTGERGPESVVAFARAFLMSHPAVPPTVGGEEPSIAVAVSPSQLRAVPPSATWELGPTSLVRTARVLVRSLCDEPDEPSEPLDEVITSVVRTLVYDSRRVHGRPAEGSRLDQLEALVELRHRDPDVVVETLARELYVSRRQLYRLVPGDGVAAMLAARRVATACRLMLVCPELSMQEIAHESGFRSGAAMRAHLHSKLGISPSAYRRELQERLASFSP